MKRFIYLIIFIGICAQLQAQDAIVVKRKDGTVQRFPHGIYKGIVNFWGDETKTTDIQSVSQVLFPQSPSLGEGWNVSGYVKNAQNFYQVFIFWNTSAPTDLPHQFCMATHPQVDLEHCDTVFQAPTNEITVNVDAKSVKYSHFIAMGAYEAFRGSSFERHGAGSSGVMFEEKLYPLLHGQTYYYRIAAHIPALRRDGGHDTLTVYGPEYAFRIPNLMAESGLVPAEVVTDGLTYPTPEAWDAFLEGVSADAGDALSDETRFALPDAATLGQMWVKWLQTTEGQAQDFTSTTDRQYDDGTIHFIDEVPAAFYQWARGRELVFSTLDNVLPVNISVLNQPKPQSEWSLVTITKEDWPLDKRTYIKVSPLTYQYTSNTTAVIDFDTRELLPGIKYCLSVTFAPEGELEDTEENAWYFTSTRLQMGFYLDGNSNQVEYLINPEQSDLTGTRYFLQSGTTPVTITLNDVVMGNRVLRIASAVRPPDLHKKTQINILRVAEVRLTPIEP